MAKVKRVAPHHAVILKDKTHLKAGDKLTAAQAKEAEALGVPTVESTEDDS